MGTLAAGLCPIGIGARLRQAKCARLKKEKGGSKPSLAAVVDLATPSKGASHVPTPVTFKSAGATGGQRRIALSAALRERLRATNGNVLLILTIGWTANCRMHASGGTPPAQQDLQLNNNADDVSKCDIRAGRVRQVMKHKASQDVFAYWNELRGTRLAPDRSEVDPAAIRSALGDTIMLAREPGQRAMFRLAGTRVCALFGRELKNEAFHPLWDVGSRHELYMLLADAGDESAGFVAGATARVGDGDPVSMELLLLPLFHRGTTDNRLIGTLAPLSRPRWLGTQPAHSLTLTSWRSVGPHIDQSVVPRFVDLPSEMERKGLVVHEGGRR